MEVCGRPAPLTERWTERWRSTTLGCAKDIPGESAFRARANLSLGNQKLDRARLLQSDLEPKFHTRMSLDEG